MRYRNIKKIIREFKRKYYCVTLSLGDETVINLSSINSYYPVTTITRDNTFLLIPLNELLTIEKSHNPNDLQSLLVGSQSSKTIEAYLERNPSDSQEEKKIEFLKWYYSEVFNHNYKSVETALGQSFTQVQEQNTKLFESKSVIKDDLSYPVLQVYHKVYTINEMRKFGAQLSQVDLAWRLAQKAFGITAILLEVLSLRLEKDFPETSANCGEMSSKFSELAQTSAEQIGRNTFTLCKIQENTNSELLSLYQQANNIVYHSHF